MKTMMEMPGLKATVSRSKVGRVDSRTVHLGTRGGKARKVGVSQQSRDTVS